MSEEGNIQRRIMLAASAASMTTWRNNTGTAWRGETHHGSHKGEKALILTNYRPVHFGLCKGSADLIGLKPTIITSAHIGASMAQFVAIEVKAPKGRLSEQQKNFLRFVEESGGLSIVARSPDDIPV